MTGGNEPRLQHLADLFFAGMDEGKRHGSTSAPAAPPMLPPLFTRIPHKEGFVGLNVLPSGVMVNAKKGKIQ